MMNIANMLNFLLEGQTTNSGLNSALSIVASVVNTITIVLYIVLGLFLLVKGAMIGVQIVKAADEPQVRQEKISSLKWLVIGVAIAYAVTIATDVLTSYFSEVFASNK